MALARTLALVLSLGVVTPARAISQGAARASIEGFVRNSAGTPLEGVLLTLADSAKGTSRTFLTRERGAYRFDNLAVGTIYQLNARRVGSVATTADRFVLHIGDRLVRDVVLDDTRTTSLSRVDVRAEPHRNAGAGGIVFTIQGDAVRNLPLRNRDVVGLFGLVPQAGNAAALSLSGQHTRFNAIQIDGSAGGDFFGVSPTPGATSGARLLSIEALEEMRVLVAPFDVSLGGFSGGLVSLVTRSGTNEHRATLFTSYAGAQLVGRDTANGEIDEFRIAQFGLRAGGPLIRNRLHYFAVADLQSSAAPFTGPSVAEPSTGISAATALRASTAFREVYGFDAGTSAEPTLRAPSRNLFGKLSWHHSTSHTLELSHAIAAADGDELARTVRNRVNRDGWQLSRSGATRRGSVGTTRFRALSSWRDVANEFVASFSTIEEERRSVQNVPLFLVQGDVTGNYLAGGSVFNAQAAATAQRIVELTDNISWNRGGHVITAGTQNQFLHFRDNLFLGAWGTWTFVNVDSLERGAPDRFERALALRPGGPIAEYDAAHLAAYVQDRWRITDLLELSLGVRADVPLVFDRPTLNSQLAANAALGGIRTNEFPSGNTIVSPRFGFAYSLRDGRTLLRGGAGGFASRAPYAWLTGAFENTGLEQATLICTVSDGVPAPTTDLRALPGACTGGAAAPPSVPTISYFSDAFRFQHAVKYALGVDHRFGRGMTASFDATYVTTHHSLYVSDVNLVALGERGEGRAMYGTIAANGSARPTRLDSAGYSRVFRFENNGGGRSRALSASVEKRWGRDGLVQAAYSWSRAEDVMSLAGLTGTIIFQNNPIDGTIAERRLSRSARDIPHSVSGAAVIPFPGRVTASLFLRARSGTPYAFVADGDANADGTAGNDLARIPADSTDISLTNPAAYGALDAFIRGEPCLRDQRGRVMRRNTCRNRAVVNLDARVTKSIDVGGRSVTIVADVFNVPNLLHKHWGLVRETTAMESTPLLRVAGWDDANARPRYTVSVVDGRFVLPSVHRVVSDPSRWRMQLGARIDF